MHPPDAEAHALLNHRWRGGQRATVYAGLAVTVPDDHMTPGSVTEVAAPSYQRIAVPCDVATFGPAADRAIEIIIDLIWPDPVEAFGVVVSIPFYDTPTKGTGNIVDAIQIQTGINVQAGGTPPTAYANSLRFVAP